MRTTVKLVLFESGADALRLDGLGRQVRSDLLRLDAVADITAADVPADGSHAVAAAPTPGTRGIDAATASTLAVAVLGSGGVTALIGTLRQWLMRGGAGAERTVRIEAGGDVLELSGATPAEQDRVVELFLRRLEQRDRP